jgi:hypothetical protein
MSRSAPLRRLILLGCLAAACVGATGCMKALFPPETPRTQFETYDRMRSRYIPLEEPDVFGTPQPALRARLGRQE